MVMKFTKDELIIMCKEGMNKYYYGVDEYLSDHPELSLLKRSQIVELYHQDGYLGPLQAVEKYFFEQTDNEYSKDSDTYKLLIKAFCDYGKDVLRKNNVLVLI